RRVDTRFGLCAIPCSVCLAAKFCGSSSVRKQRSAGQRATGRELTSRRPFTKANLIYGSQIFQPRTCPTVSYLPLRFFGNAISIGKTAGGKWTFHKQLECASQQIQQTHNVILSEAKNL